jgi:hypothetical protein
MLSLRSSQHSQRSEGGKAGNKKPELPAVVAKVKTPEPTKSASKIKSPEPVNEAELEKYEVIVKTADEANAETDASVLIGLYGEKQDVLFVPLMHKSSNGVFARNSVERFELKLKDTGKIKRIALRHNGTGKGASWKVEYVKIFHKDTVYMYFFFQFLFFPSNL